MFSSKLTGAKAERIAEKFLQQQGLKTVECNFNCRFGELDLIMQDVNELVFVEVRYRQTNSHGGPLQSIDAKKCKKLWATAEMYLQLHPKLRNGNQRFDVVGIVGDIDSSNHSLEWLKNAITDY